MKFSWYYFYRNKNHCLKSAQIRSFFWSVFSRIRTEYGPAKTPYFDTFHAVKIQGDFQTCIIVVPLKKSFLKSYRWQDQSYLSKINWETFCCPTSPTRFSKFCIISRKSKGIFRGLLVILSRCYIGRYYVTVSLIPLFVKNVLTICIHGGITLQLTGVVIFKNKYFVIKSVLLKQYTFT